MSSIDELRVLKTLDPAGPDADPLGPKAQASLQRILAADPAPPRQRHRVAVRVAVGAGLAAAVTAAAIVVPSSLGGDKAFATWTAVPAGMSAADSAEAAASCRDRQKSGSPEHRNDLARSTTAISERRGDWTLVVLAGQEGFSALCITDRPRPLFQSYFGSIGSTPGRPGPRGLTATSLGTGASDGNELSVAAGLAGSDVTGVSYSSPSRGKVTATVSSGQFALWFPGNELEHASSGVVLQVTYRDGTTAPVTVKL